MSVLCQHHADNVISLLYASPMLFLHTTKLQITATAWRMAYGTQDKSNHGCMVTGRIVCETVPSLLADQYLNRIALHCSEFDFVVHIVRHKD